MRLLAVQTQRAELCILDLQILNKFYSIEHWVLLEKYLSYQKSSIDTEMYGSMQKCSRTGRKTFIYTLKKKNQCASVFVLTESDHLSLPAICLRRYDSWRTHASEAIGKRKKPFWKRKTKDDNKVRRVNSTKEQHSLD